MHFPQTTENGSWTVYLECSQDADIRKVTIEEVTQDEATLHAMTDWEPMALTITTPGNDGSSHLPFGHYPLTIRGRQVFVVIENYDADDERDNNRYHTEGEIFRVHEAAGGVLSEEELNTVSVYEREQTMLRITVTQPTSEPCLFNVSSQIEPWHAGSTPFMCWFNLLPPLANTPLESAISSEDSEWDGTSETPSDEYSDD